MKTIKLSAPNLKKKKKRLNKKKTTFQKKFKLIKLKFKTWESCLVWKMMKLKSMLRRSNRLCRPLKMKAFFLANQLNQKFSPSNNSNWASRLRMSNNNFLSKFWLQKKIVKVKMFWILFRNKTEKWKMKVLDQNLKIQKIQLVIMRKVDKKTMLKFIQSKKF